MDKMLLTRLFNPEVLATALSLMHEIDFEAPSTPERKAVVDVGRILATAWSPERLVRCLEKEAEGTKPPPVYLIPYVLPDLDTYYVVGDGMHRTVAARLRQHRLIEARVSSHQQVKPQHYFVGTLYETDALWLNYEGEENERGLIAEPSEEVLAVCRYLIDRFKTFPKSLPTLPWAAR